MNLDELRAFLAVVDGGSLAAASTALRFPMATLRRRIDELEVRMGVKLLVRSRQGAVPTSAGSVLASKARSILSEVQSLAELVRVADIEPSGDLVLAVQQGLPPQLVGRFLLPLMMLHPKVVWRVHTSEGSRSRYIERCQRGALPASKAAGGLTPRAGDLQATSAARGDP
jgi:DNA-binding transcriptional LysR family regulator